MLPLETSQNPTHLDARHTKHPAFLHTPVVFSCATIYAPHHNMTALGFVSLINRIASGKRSLSSSFPNCFPAMENGGQGTPPASKSTPLYGFPLKFLTSLQITFHSGLFNFNTLQYSSSYSTSATCTNPANASPSAWLRHQHKSQHRLAVFASPYPFHKHLITIKH